MINLDIYKRLHGSNGKMELSLHVDIQEGDFVALTGKSGSGKTTLLRIIAGLVKSRSTIKVGNEIWLDRFTSKPVQERGIGFVFQDYALFENMSVEKNLLFVVKNKSLCDKLLDITDMKALRERLPGTLSGGQKQRVGLCRAMMKKPKLLLLDEPFSALDVNMKSKLQDEILVLHKEFKTTTIMVSHDPSEMYKLANRVILLENGKIIKDGNAKDVLLKTSGSQKFSFEGEVLSVEKIDVIYIAIISIGQQLSEIVISEDEAKNLFVGKKVRVGTKAFAPTLS